MTDLLTQAARAHTERLEYEILGAWRAGYDYLHVYSGTDTLTHYPDKDVSAVGLQSFHIRTAVFPSYYERPPAHELDGYRYAETYILDDDVMFEAPRLTRGA